MIPTAVLRNRVTIDPYEGTTGTGTPTFGLPLVDVPARVVTKTRQSRTVDGVTVTYDAVIQCRPTFADPAPQSLVTDGDRVYTVVASEVVTDLLRPHHIDLLVDGPRPVAA